MELLPDNAAHILVVDDDQRIRDLLARYLFENGFRVTAAADAATARATMAGLVFDVVILDVMMPGENGIDLARDLKGTSNIPICMLTARAEPEERIQGLEIGVDDYIAKPFEPRELLLRLQNILKPSVSATSCGTLRSGRARRSPATSWRPTTRPAPSAPSTCRSTGCAARSRTILPIRCICRRCGARATSFTPTEEKRPLAKVKHARPG
jgi:DNA-binding response OmpR family regulator